MGWRAEGGGRGLCQHALSEDPRSCPRSLWGGHAAAGQQGLQPPRGGGQHIAFLGCGSHPSSFGPHYGVRAPPSSRPALPFLDHLLSELRQLAPPAIFGEPVIAPLDPWSLFFAARPPPTSFSHPAFSGTTPSAVPTLRPCHPGGRPGPPELAFCRSGA